MIGMKKNFHSFIIVKKNFQSVIIVKKNNALNVLLPIDTELYVVLDDRREKKRGGRPFKSFKDKKEIYVKFTDNQREYMREIFKVNIYPENYIDLFHIIKSIGFIGQYITIKNIKSWFSNERFSKNPKNRRRIKKNCEL